MGKGGFLLESPSSETLAALLPSPERKARMLARARARRLLPGERTEVHRLLQPVRGAVFTPGRGQALIDALAAMPPSRSRYGVDALTFDQFYGTATVPALCEDPMIDLTLEHRGETFEARYRTQNMSWLTTLEPALYALTSTCTGALAVSAGAIGTAIGRGCAREDEAAHFPAGSACRACLEIDGDHARCVTESACRVEMTRELELGGRWYDVLESLALRCAPNFMGEMVLLALELGEDNQIPAPFAQPAIFAICEHTWDRLGGRPAMNCYPADARGAHPTYSDALIGWAEYIRRPGEQTTTYYDRLWMASSVEIEGITFEVGPHFPGFLAQLSMMDRAMEGWAYDPKLMRPDGVDSYARDWISAVGLKTATNVDGVIISTFNRNLCPANDWKGPDAKGRYFCPSASYGEGNRPPDEERWNYDYGAFNFSISPPIVEMTPAMTLAATGHPDPRIPGGHILHLLGSTSLADPDWENCAWPDMFEPDEMANADTLDLSYYTFTSQTYRFGKDSRFDIRVGLSTNGHREFCWEAIPDL